LPEPLVDKTKNFGLIILDIESVNKVLLGILEAVICFQMPLEICSRTCGSTVWKSSILSTWTGLHIKSTDSLNPLLAKLTMMRDFFILKLPTDITN
jgi:hypothetical protein